MMIFRGVDPKTVAEMLGDTVEVVWRTYVHLWENARDKARTAIADGMAELFCDDEDEGWEEEAK